MGLMARADSAVLDWHQDVVDALQRQPLWICRRLIPAIAACWLARFALQEAPATWVSVVSAVVSVFALWLTCQSAAFLASVGVFRFIRYVFLVLACVDVAAALALAFSAPAPINAVDTLRSLLFTAFYYFAACRPPRPRPPRRAAALSPSANPA